MFYGLDVHKAFIQVCQLDPSGKQRREFRVEATAEGIEAFARTLDRRSAVALESTFHSWAIAEILRHYAGRVVVANALEVKAIAHARIKTDKVDAHTLGQLLRLDFLPEVQLPCASSWELRQLVSHRRHLLKHRVALKNTTHAILHRRLAHYTGSDLFTGPGRRWLAALPLSAAERFQLDNTLRLLDATEDSLQAVDAELITRASSLEEVKLLMTIPGIDVTVAVALVAAIDNIKRFPSPGQLVSYFGLAPRLRQSAGRSYSGGITKRGNSTVRHLAIEAGHALARTSSPLVASYYRIRHKRGHNVAVTALARKLIVLSWHLLSKREPYRYAAPARTRVKLRTVTPGRRRARPGQVPHTLEAIYTEAGLPGLQPAPAGEHRAIARNRRTVTKLRTTDAT